MGGIPFLQDLRLAALLRRAQSGEEKAFRDLYRGLHPVVAGYVARRIRSRADADDIVARVFEKLVVSLAEIDPRRGGARAFVLGVARNAAIDHARAHGSGRPAALPLDQLADRLADGRDGALDALIVQEEARAVLALLRRYPDDLREMFDLRFGDGLRCGEIARLLGMTEAAVKQRFSRALREMRSALGGDPAREALDYGY